MTAFPCESYYAQLNKYNERDKTDKEIEKRDKRIEKLELALRSIAANSCCDSCREAALVARKALEGKDD